MIEKYDPQEFRKELFLDLAVIGGGVSGVVTAIAAARLGLKVGLMQNRPVFGGPSSSECNSANDGDRLCVNGASEYYNRNARETGIIEEMKLEFFRRVENGWYNHWSLVLHDFVKREKNIVSFRNCEAYEVTAADNKISQVKGRLVGSETTVIFNAPLFVDASGDSFVGAAAGADFRMGREGRDEFNEPLSPEKADKCTQGNTILFRAIDTGAPVKFAPPEWAMKFHNDKDLPYRPHHSPVGGYWWIESGGTENTISDNEKIYDDLLAVLYGVWDHLKNHGDHGAENYVINWVSPFVGKRESRRLLGDYILTQGDLTESRSYPDQVAYGGWPLDIHDVNGIRGKSHPGSTPPMTFPGIYAIPFRSLYSRNIENLMMPGRNISASHVALGSSRVMATCATCGQAVGTAAALCLKYGKSPRRIGQEHIRELQQKLFETDQALPGMRFAGSSQFEVSATSAMPLRFGASDGIMPLVALPVNTYDPCDIPPADRTRAQLLPVSDNFIESVTVMVDNGNSGETTLEATLFIPADQHDFAGKEIAVAQNVIPSGKNIPVKFEFNAELEKVPLVGIKFSRTAGVDIHSSSCALPGVHLKPDGCYINDTNICCEVLPEQRVFEAQNVFSGLNRAHVKPEMWIGEATLPQSLIFKSEKTQEVNEIEIIFDTNLNKNPLPGCVPQSVKAYDILIDGKVVVSVEDNFQRRRLHKLAAECTNIEIRITATNGIANPRVYGVCFN